MRWTDLFGGADHEQERSSTPGASERATGGYKTSIGSDLILMDRLKLVQLGLLHAAAMSSSMASTITQGRKP